MDSLVRDTLATAGVPVDNDDDAMTHLELWLDMDTNELVSASTPTTIALMEDCAPFSSSFYQCVGRVLVEAWNPQSNATTSQDILAIYNEEGGTSISLFQTQAVQVTRWLRHWMELNVTGSSSSSKDSFSQLLLQYCEGNVITSTHPEKNEEGRNTSKSGSRLPRTPILAALFHHIAALPQLQQNIYRHVHNARMSNTSQAGSAARVEQMQSSQELAEKMAQELEQHLGHLEEILGEWYTLSSAAIRGTCRMHLGVVWHRFSNTSSSPLISFGAGQLENTSACGIDTTLRVLHRILEGTSDELHSSHEHLLLYALIPLHKPSSMVLWRDQTALLQLYHEPLVQCMAVLLRKQPRWISRAIAHLMLPDIWASVKGGSMVSANTPKVILLLHEIDTFLDLLPEPISQDMFDVMKETIRQLVVRLGACIASDNSRVAERALQFFRNVNFTSMLKQDIVYTLPTLLRSLCRVSDQMNIHWNPTVRKMTRLVLQQLESLDEQTFIQSCRNIIGGGSQIEQHDPIPMVKAAAPSPFPSAVVEEKEPYPPPSSLPPSLGQYRSMLPPPSRPPKIKKGKTPPLTSTGIAPWTTSSKLPSRPKKVRNGEIPPLTITGVAPWAVSSAHRSHLMRNESEAQAKPSLKSLQPTKKRSGEIKEPPDQQRITKANTLTTDQPQAILEENSIKPSPGLARVRLYMDQLKDNLVDEEDGASVSAWAQAQIAECPTLLPTLKFHDLVFGHELGKGAFGSVRYARQIVKSKTRSYWPEYAVKVVSTQKIEELGYEQSINREIATLRLLSHPGIARLISSFRFRDGAYLVLEYASGGDLFNLLRKVGSLDHESTKFVAGEMVAALSSIHDLGFVYSDLKPENVLITETGHVKLTDFGACRPVTARAKKLVRSFRNDGIRQLRNGDWKNNISKSKPIDQCEDTTDLETEEDNRIEGTVAYLPPEVIIGYLPTPSADSWALGCVLYQCISGRPPLLADNDSMTKNKIVAFNSSDSDESGPCGLFTAAGNSSAFHIDAKALIRRLLQPEPESRPNMLQVAEDSFFAGINIFSLYRQSAPPLDVGSIAPVSEGKWARRQFSSIWAPQPPTYAISSQEKNSNTYSSCSKKAPIIEGDESPAFFSKKTQQNSDFSRIPENRTMLQS